MKFLTILSCLFFVVSSQASSASEPIEVIQVQGQQLVLIPTSTAVLIDAVLKSELDEAAKIAEIKSVVAELATLKEGQETFCSVAGSVYQTVNKGAAEMALQCEERLADGEMFEELPEGEQTVESLRDLYSRTAALVITFSIF